MENKFEAEVTEFMIFVFDRDNFELPGGPISENSN